MAFLDTLKGFFSRKKTIDQVTPDELRREKIRMEQNETRVIREVDELEKQKEALFLKGRDEPSQRQQLILARKIKELDSQAKAKDKQLALISRHLRAINGFVQLKENKKVIEQMGMGSVLSDMDLDELQVYVENATVDGEFQMDRFGQLVKSLEGGDGLNDMVSEDADTLAIVEAMRDAKSAEAGEPEESAREGLRKVDDILAKTPQKEAPEAD